MDDLRANMNEDDLPRGVVLAVETFYKDSNLDLTVDSDSLEPLDATKHNQIK